MQWVKNTELAEVELAEVETSIKKLRYKMHMEC